MGSIENSLFPLGLVLFFGLFVPQLLNRLRLPATTSMILAGAIVGPHGFAYIEPDSTLKIFAFMGATFHMLLAGFESEKLNIEDIHSKVWPLFIINGLLPGALGVWLLRSYNASWPAAFLVGAVFLSSSIMLTFSYTRHLGIVKTPLGRSLRSLVVIEDLASTLVVFLVFQGVAEPGRFPLPILLGLLLCSVILLRMFLPELVLFAFRKLDEQGNRKEEKLRVLLAVLIGVIAFYSATGVHAVVAAFLVGFSLAGLPEVEPAQEKLRTLGYGIFVPVFLFVIGTELNFKELVALPDASGVVVVVSLSAIALKIHYRLCWRHCNWLEES
jgi:Kef-type K+ transport system membrane component KefB